MPPGQQPLIAPLPKYRGGTLSQNEAEAMAFARQRSAEAIGFPPSGTVSDPYTHSGFDFSLPAVAIFSPISLIDRLVITINSPHGNG
jgi:hypothetical protein